MTSLACTVLRVHAGQVSGEVRGRPVGRRSVVTQLDTHRHPGARRALRRLAASLGEVGVVGGGDVGVCAETGLEQVVAEGAGDGVVGVLADSTSLFGESGR